MSIRVFEFTGRVVIDSDEAIAEENRDVSNGVVTLDELQAAVLDGLRIEFLTEDCDELRRVGIQSTELLWNTLKELSPEIVQRDYPRPAPGG